MVTLGAALGWNIFQDQMMRAAFIPPFAFSKASAAETPDYASASAWLSRPDLPDDPSRWTPPGILAAANPKVAVFYVSPTTYLRRDRWNSPLNDLESGTRSRLLAATQASAFNSVGAVWSPRYRQATLGAFLTTSKSAMEARDLAYQDVERAFDAFLAAIPASRPIMLVGHSQGSLHLMRLMQRRVANTPLWKRIVAAYLVGWPVSIEADLPALGLPGCTGADQGGCVISWQSFAEPADPHQLFDIYNATEGLTGRPLKGTKMLCINPLTGAPDSAADSKANLGALVPRAGLEGADLMPGLVPAKCDPSGILLIGFAPPGYGAYVLPGNNYHVFDYALFWANIRADAEARLKAFELNDHRSR
jgi:hypothetical protein